MEQNTVQRYQALMEKKQQIERRVVELETTFNHHKTEFQRILTQLKEQYKVDSLKEAYELRDKMQANASKQLDELEQAISKFEHALQAKEESNDSAE